MHGLGWLYWYASFTIMSEIMLSYGPNGRRRLGRPSKVLIDTAATGLLIHLHSIPFSGLCLASKILDDGQGSKQRICVFARPLWCWGLLRPTSWRILTMIMNSGLQNVHWNIQISSLSYIKEVKCKELLWIERGDLDLYVWQLVKSLYTKVACFSLCVYAGRASSLYVNWMKKKQPFSLGSVLFPTRKTSYLKRWLTQFYSIAFRTELSEAVSGCSDCESLGYHSGIAEASLFRDRTRLYTPGY